MSPMIVIASVIKPPAPMRCSPRKTISSVMFWDRPASADPIRNTTIANWNTLLRPWRSLILPYSGVVTVDATRYAVTTHERWFRPPRSPTIVGSAVATIVWSSAASSMPSMSPPRMTMICRWVYVLGCTPPPCSATQASLTFDVLHESLEQVGEAVPVGRVPSREHLPERAVARLTDAGDEVVAHLRRRDDRRAAVARVVRADDEAGGLELRHLAARRGDVEP